MISPSLQVCKPRPRTWPSSSMSHRKERPGLATPPSGGLNYQFQTPRSLSVTFYVLTPGRPTGLCAAICHDRLQTVRGKNKRPPPALPLSPQHATCKRPQIWSNGGPSSFVPLVRPSRHCPSLPDP